MPVKRDRPYSAFNFLVSIDGVIDDSSSVEAGFQEVGGLGLEFTMQEYRPGNHVFNSTIKIIGTHKFPDVTLKRGLIGATDLYTWIKAVRDGAQDQLRTVRIELQNEEHTGIVMAWTLYNARPLKYTGPAFNGKGTDVAVEELVLAVERVAFDGVDS